MANESLNIKINKNGTMTVDAAGYQGQACLKDLEALEKYLQDAGVDTRITDQVMKAQAYAPNTSTHNSTWGGQQ